MQRADRGAVVFGFRVDAITTRLPGLLKRRDLITLLERLWKDIGNRRFNQIQFFFALNTSNNKWIPLSEQNISGEGRGGGGGRRGAL